MVDKPGQVPSPCLALRLGGLPKCDDHSSEGRCACEPFCERPPLRRTPLLPDASAEQKDQGQSGNDADGY
jgi:hypothetical protein